MKTCPKCNRTYTDETLSFCLDDGTPLAIIDQNQSYDPQATLFMAEPPNLQTSQIENRTTAGGQPPPPQQPSSPHNLQPTIQSSSIPYSQQSSPFTPAIPQQQTPYQTPSPSWQPPVSPQAPQKKRSFLPWVIAGVGLIVVGGIGVVLVIAIIAAMNTNANENKNQNNDNKIAINKNTNNSNKSNTNTYNSNNSNSNNGDSVDTSFLSNEFLAANSDKGASTTVFRRTDKIYFVFTVTYLPRRMEVVSKLVVDSVTGEEPGTSVDTKSTFEKGFSGTFYFYFTPGTGGWPDGSYHVELLEKKPDGTLVKLKRIDLTVE
jgi:hypothetical protein